jgi:membrane fusion protein (multidrug efflux system)
MWVNFSVSENQILRLREAVGKGQIKLPDKGNFTVELVLADGSVFQNRGSISFADPSFSKETGTFLVRATFENRDGTLKPGQFVRVHVLGATRPNAILVPQRAVQQGAKSHFVWVVAKDGKAEQRAVAPGDWAADDWVIEQGLQAGEQVVVDGAIRVTAGAALKVSAYSPPKPTEASVARTTAVPTLDEQVFSEKGPRQPASRPEPPTLQQKPAPRGSGSNSLLPARVHFAYRQATLDEKAAGTISAVAAALKGGQETIEVTGYADKRGNAERNRKIAEERARAVRDALVAGGVEESRIALKQPAIATGSGSDDEARRVEITLGRPRPS